RHHANHAGANHPGPGRLGSLPDLAVLPGNGDLHGGVVDEAPAGVGAADRAAANGKAAGSGWSDAEDGQEPDYSPMVVREKTHTAAPMTLDDALSNMELVGHDFYLFLDADTGLPSVVYRRCGYDYGVIRLTAQAGQNGSGDAHGSRERTAAVISAV
ncbi:sigma 54 modulation/S30EA ribosomal C-terminal domain-containing protein, partial [Frankia sp. EI5c]|uniref:sigma 54 modulation/S30EA ribosomal C-terminal domain-containing protein n=1 Tax=Frankia sp. EI5c TaxID=683316 RepID=UPI001F5B46CC